MKIIPEWTFNNISGGYILIQIYKKDALLKISLILCKYFYINPFKL